MNEIPDLLAKRASLTPRKTAMSDLITGRTSTYRALNHAADSAAGLMRSEGAAAGDRVAILCRNRIEFFEALFACARIGALFVPLNWRMPANELKSIIADCRPKLILVGAEDVMTLRAANPECAVIALDDPGGEGYRRRLAAAEPAPPRAFWPAGDAWYLLYTSGTTGKPKAVIQTFQMALVNYINIGQAIDLRSDDVTLNFLPLFHTAGINLYTLPVLIAGGEVKVLPGLDVEKTMDLLAAGALTAFFGVPAVYQALSLHPKFAESDLSKVRSWGCGGAPLPDILVETFAARGARVCGGYGMTETGPTAFLMREEDITRKIGSVGRAQIMTASRIVRSDGHPVETGETGEMQLKGPGITPGYWNAPEATRAAFTEDGWLKTGDLAMEDENGFAYIVGRLKEMYISGGENVYPAEVENVYARHPAVLEAAVIGIPDEKWGEVGRAFILLREGARADAEELSRFGRDNLAAYKAPKSFVFVDDFPRTAAGKVQKHLLAKE